MIYYFYGDFMKAKDIILLCIVLILVVLLFVFNQRKAITSEEFIKVTESYHLKTFYTKRSKTNFINNNTNSLIGNQSSINQRKTNNYGKKIILSGNHYGRNEKFLSLKYACGNTFNNNKSNRKKILLNK